jgi:hypothetical protein
MQSTSPMLFELETQAASPKRLIRTTYTDEREMLNDILYLYNGGKGVDVDPCYSIGRFWQGLPQPKHKFDLEPQVEGTIKSSCANLPLASSSVKSIMFDPPFLIGIGESTSGKMLARFSGFKNMAELKSLYTNSLKEFYRILEDKGLLIFKCQDTVTSGKQFLTHVFIVNEAEKMGYYVRDLFILVRDSAIVDPRWGEQQHARKTHSYYVVLFKGLLTRRAVDEG